MKVLPYTCKRADPKSSHPGTPGTGTAHCKPPAPPPLYTYPSTTSSFLSANLPQKANHHPPPNFPLEMHPISSTNCTNFQWKFTPISSANSTDFQYKFQRKGHGKADMLFFRGGWGALLPAVRGAVLTMKTIRF